MVTRTLNHLDLLLHCPWPISALDRPEQMQSDEDFIEQTVSDKECNASKSESETERTFPSGNDVKPWLTPPCFASRSLQSTSLVNLKMALRAEGSSQAVTVRSRLVFCLRNLAPGEFICDWVS